jgi:TRAP-type C4-dicarboxylate transport system permease small subunit
MGFVSNAFMGGSAVFGLLTILVVSNVIFSYVSPTSSTFTEAIAGRTGLPNAEVI